MKKSVLLFVVLLSVLGVTRAEEVAQEPQLGVNLDLTYTSRWMSKGIDVFRSQGGFFETVDFDFYGTGLGFRLTHRSSTGGPYALYQRFDYRPYYKGSLFEDDSYKTNFDLSVGYEHYYRKPMDEGPTTWEWIGAFSWPQLIGGGLVPKYIAHYEHPASDSSLGNSITGWVHRFILDYNIPVESLTNPVKFSSEIAYYDGLLGRPSVWAYSTFGLSTKLNVNENLAFVPGIYYQITMDDEILRDGKDENIFYGMVSMKYAF